MSSTLFCSLLLLLGCRATQEPTTPAAIASTQTASAEPVKEASAAEGARFTIKKDVVIDNKTGLMWAAQDSYKAGKTEGLNWYEAKEYCDAYTAGGYDDWRMPSLAELKELYATFAEKDVQLLEEVYWSKRAPVIIDTTKQENNVPIWIYSGIWASDEDSELSMAGTVTFDLGRAQSFDTGMRSSNYNVLPVRAKK